MTASPPLQLPPVIQGITRGDERIFSIAGDAADSPYSTADGMSVAAAHAVTLAGLSIGTPTSQP